MNNPVLDSNNAEVTVTKFRGSTVAGLVMFDGMPLGTADGSATGELGLKVIVIAETSVGGTATAANQVLQLAKTPALGTAIAPSTDVITTQRPAVTQVVSTALEASHILKASAGQLVELAVFSNTAGYILLMNSTTLPADGAVTLLYPPIPIAANQLFVLDLPAPLVASTGIVACISSTGSFTKTIGGSTCAFYAQVN